MQSHRAHQDREKVATVEPLSADRMQHACPFRRPAAQHLDSERSDGFVRPHFVNMPLPREEVVGQCRQDWNARAQQQPPWQVCAVQALHTTHHLSQYMQYHCGVQDAPTHRCVPSRVDHRDPTAPSPRCLCQTPTPVVAHDVGQLRDLVHITPAKPHHSCRRSTPTSRRVKTRLNAQFQILDDLCFQRVGLH